jgi:hypothetical protein
MRTGVAPLRTASLNACNDLSQSSAEVRHQEEGLRMWTDVALSGLKNQLDEKHLLPLRSRFLALEQTLFLSAVRSASSVALDYTVLKDIEA